LIPADRTARGPRAPNPGYGTASLSRRTRAACGTVAARFDAGDPFQPNSGVKFFPTSNQATSDGIQDPFWRVSDILISNLFRILSFDIRI
jgi:hypothetical protein